MTEDPRPALPAADTSLEPSREEPRRRPASTGGRPFGHHLAAVATVLAILMAWKIVTARHWVTDVLVPAPEQVWRAFLSVVREGYKEHSLARHLADSLTRLVTAFGLAFVAGVPLGLLSGTNRYVRAVLDPLVEFYRPLPPLAYYTLLVLWMGIENGSKIALLCLAGFAPIYLASAAGIGRIEPDFLHGARTLGASRRQIFFHVILPAALPDIFTGLRTAIGVTYTTLVAAEMVAAVTGIGWMVLDASKFLRSDVIVMGIILMGLTGVGLDLLVRLLERLAMPWRTS